jgi:hypothetical protein
MTKGAAGSGLSALRNIPSYFFYRSVFHHRVLGQLRLDFTGHALSGHTVWEKRRHTKMSAFDNSAPVHSARILGISKRPLRAGGSRSKVWQTGASERCSQGSAFGQKQPFSSNVSMVLENEGCQKRHEN